MFIATFFIIAKIYKEPKYPWMDEWFKKMWEILYIHERERKKKEILPFATTLINIKGIMLSGISQRKTNTT